MGMLDTSTSHLSTIKCNTLENVWYPLITIQLYIYLFLICECEVFQKTIKITGSMFSCFSGLQEGNKTLHTLDCIQKSGQNVNFSIYRWVKYNNN